MRNKITLGALAGVAAAALAAVALANPAADTTFEISTKVKPNKAGTKKHPRPFKSVELKFTGGTVSGTGQPSTTTKLIAMVPKQWLINAKRWPRKARCDMDEANSKQTDSICPRASKIGTGSATAVGSDGAIVQNLSVKAYVVTDGNAGFHLRSLAPVSVSVNQMISGTLKGRKLIVNIPENLQEPIGGLETGITVLKTTFKGSARIGGRKRGLVESTGCVKRNWTVKGTNVYRDGQNTASQKIRCRK